GQRHGSVGFQRKTAYAFQELLTRHVLFFAAPGLARLGGRSRVLPAGFRGGLLGREIEGFAHELVSVAMIPRILLEDKLHRCVEIGSMHRNQINGPTFTGPLAAPPAADAPCAKPSLTNPPRAAIIPHTETAAVAGSD